MTDPYASGVLNREAHGRLVEQLDEFCEQARVPRKYVLQRMAAFNCEDDEITWTRHFREHVAHGKTGLIYLGSWSRVLERMHAMAGALIRNFIDARVWTVQEVVEAAHEGEPPLFTALLIPNFVATVQGKGLAPWHVAELHRTLIARHSAEKQTVISVASEKELRAVYGDAVAQHVFDYYTAITPS